MLNIFEINEAKTVLIEIDGDVYKKMVNIKETHPTLDENVICKVDEQSITALQKEFIELFKTSVNADYRAHSMRQQDKKSKAIRNDSLKFRAFISKVGSNSKFCEFLKEIKETYENKELTTFVRDYLYILDPKSVNYKRFLGWSNYNTNNKRHLISSAFYEFYENLCKTPTKKVVVKGIVAKAMKSQRAKLDDEGTLKEYTYESIVKTTNTQKVIDGIAAFRKRFMSLIPISRDDTYGLGILQTYAYKFGFIPWKSAFQEKRKSLKAIQNRSRRIEKIKVGVNKVQYDYQAIKNFLQRNCGYELLAEFDGKKLSRGLTVVGKIMRTKYFNDWGKSISKDLTQEKLLVAVNKGKLFIKDFEKKVKTNKYLMGK